MIYAGIILSFLLGVSVIFGIYKHQKDAYKSTYSQTLSDAKENVNSAISLKSVDINKARQSFLKGREQVNGLIKKGIKDPEIDTLNKLISGQKGDILGEKQVASEMWLDLTLIKDGFSSEQVVLSDGQVSVPDFTDGNVVNVDLMSKKSSNLKIAGGIKGASILTANMSGVYALADDGVYNLSSGEKDIDKNWEGVSGIFSYASNIYLLDSKAGAILKSAGVDKGFSESKKWTTSDKENFSQVKAFVVDGFAWVLSSDGLNKYSYGNKIKFELKNYPYQLPAYDKLYSDENLGNLYLLNKAGKTISVFNRDGEYQYNLASDILGETKDFVVSESEKKIIVLAGAKLYSLPLSD